MKSKNELILTFLKWHFAASQIRSEYENENANLSFRYSIFSALPVGAPVQKIYIAFLLRPRNESTAVRERLCQQILIVSMISFNEMCKQLEIVIEN